jgi:hypothetical protein
MNLIKGDAGIGIVVVVAVPAATVVDLRRRALGGGGQQVQGRQLGDLRVVDEFLKKIELSVGLEESVGVAEHAEMTAVVGVEVDVTGGEEWGVSCAKAEPLE